MHGLVPQYPGELGFPEKFASWRPNQPSVIEESILCDKRVIANCAPTGFGKSGCYVGQAKLEGGRTAILTDTKGLQDQLMDDHQGMGLVQIKGKDNYACTHNPEWTCKDGHASQCPMKGNNECPYTLAYNTARTADIVCTNYKFWIAVHRYGTGLGKFDRVVLDEAHVCPDEVADSMQVRLSYHEIQEMLRKDFPKGEPSGDIWKEWAKQMVPVARNETLAALKKIQATRSPKPSWINNYHHLKNITQKLSILALMRPKDWVWESLDWGWQFDPIRFERYSESRLLLGIPKVIMYSATLREKTLHMLGIAKEKYKFTDWPAIYDPRRSPIYQIPTMRVDSRAGGDYSLLVLRCDQIMGPRLNLGRNGIIQVTSFKYRDSIFYNSAFRQELISHFEDSNSRRALEKFKLRGGVLISPSIWEGLDLKDDICRFIILTKIPFQPRSKVIDARQQVDNLYGAYNAMQKIGQGVGRGTRSEEDWCESFMTDNHMSDWFARRYSFLAPKHFWQRYKVVNSIPRPLEVN